MMSSTTRSRARLIIGGGVAIAVVGALGVAGAVALGGDDKAAATTPRTATVSTGDVTLTVSAAGTVNAVGARTLSFGASGTVSSLKVAAGDTVAKGAVLARLDTEDARDAVESAQDNVDAAYEALTSAEAAVTAAEEAAARGAATPTTSPGTSGSAAGPVEGGSGPTSGSGGSRGSASRQGSSADAVFAAQQRLNNAELALANAKRVLAGTTIKAPVAGKIISISGAVGSEVGAGGAFIVLAGRDDLAVTASFSEAAVARLEVGQAATVSLAGRAADPVAGTVSQVDPVGTVSSRLVTYGAQITFTDVPSDLLVGQSADVTVTTATATGVRYVPSEAVTGSDGQSGTVTVASGGGSAPEVRTVGIGLRGDRYIEITSGLTAGETVVLPG